MQAGEEEIRMRYFSSTLMKETEKEADDVCAVVCCALLNNLEAN